MHRFIRAAIGVAAVAVSGVVASPGAAQAPQPQAPDSTLAKIVVVWNQVTPVAPGARIVDVAFTSVGLNVVSPVEMIWCLDAAAHEIVAVASKPITGTAAAGEVMGKRGTGLLRDPAALCVAANAPYVLESNGRLDILRSGWTDSLELGAATGTERDVVVPATGLVYVLLGSEVRVYADPPGKAPLWKFSVDPKLAPATALSVSAGGTVYVAGRGTLALAAYELDARGAYRIVKSRTKRELAAQQISGIALTPNLLLPLPGREGWIGQDRFLVIADAGAKKLTALESKDLTIYGSADVAADVPALAPGRIDVSNRGQIAVADVASGAAYALPARLLAHMLEPAKVRWRSIDPDSIAAGHGP
jgi:hypothetical protein